MKKDLCTYDSGGPIYLSRNDRLYNVGGIAEGFLAQHPSLGNKHASHSLSGLDSDENKSNNSLHKMNLIVRRFKWGSARNFQKDNCLHCENALSIGINFKCSQMLIRVRKSQPEKLLSGGFLSLLVYTKSLHSLCFPLFSPIFELLERRKHTEEKFGI